MIDQTDSFFAVNVARSNFFEITGLHKMLSLSSTE